MITARSLTSLLLLALLGCGGAPARPARATPDATGAYDLRVEHEVPAGASWDEHAIFEVEETQVTQVLDNAETTVSRQRVELFGRVTVLPERRASILVTALTADDGTGSGPRVLAAPGETLVVTHGDSGTIVGPRGPYSEADDALLRRVIHVSSSESGHDDAAAAFGPPGGLARVGETWTLDHEALAAIFRGQHNDVRVRPEDVEGLGRLVAAEPWEGLDEFRIELDLSVHDMGVEIPPGATMDDIEVRMVGGASWPLDTGVPGAGDAMRVESTMALSVNVPEAPGVVARVGVSRVEVSRRARSAFRAP